eukprot:6870706-Prymnesium_polylepis.1
MAPLTPPLAVPPQDEVAGIALACERFLAQGDGQPTGAGAEGRAGRTGGVGTARACCELLRVASELQAATDEEVGLLHALATT